MSEEDPDRPASPEERAEAEAFGTKLDSLLAGDGLPAVTAPDERELLEVSSMIAASHNESVLADDRQTALINNAIAQAMDVGEVGQAPALSLSEAREKRQRRHWPILAMVAAAAAIVFLVFRPRPSTIESPVASTIVLPIEQQSRPSDRLIGPIEREESDHARDRLDQIYGDRLSGYRALRYQRLVGKQ